MTTRVDDLGSDSITEWRMALSDIQIANILFNETRSLNGARISEARIDIAHAIINAEGSDGGLPKMASSHVHVPEAEHSAFSECALAVQRVRADIAAKRDPTSGATHFNFRKNSWKGNFFGNKLLTSVGPLDNSFPTDDLPATGIYANTYE